MPKPRRVLVINEVARQDYLDLFKQSVLNWGHDQAAQYKGSLDTSMERLLEFPDMGRSAPELFRDGHRLRVKHHAIYYTFSDDSVIVHRILHERRRVTPMMFVETDD
jgi:toxin ParE1/3/4